MPDNVAHIFRGDKLRTTLCRPYQFDGYHKHRGPAIPVRFTSPVGDDSVPCKECYFEASILIKIWGEHVSGKRKYKRPDGLPPPARTSVPGPGAPRSEL